MSTRQKIFILGCGAQGTVIAKRINEEENVSEVICADYDIKSARRLEKIIDKATAAQVNASNIVEIIQASKGADLIVNAVPPEFNMNIMNAALKGNMNYLDMASGPIEGVPFVETVTQQLDLNEKWKKAGLRALINTGKAPGMSNVVARNCADNLDSCEKIKVWLYASLETGKFIPFWWSPETGWGDMAAKPTVFKKRKFVEVEPFSNEEEFEIRGLGLRRFVSHEHEEAVTFGLYFKGLEYAEVKMGGSTCDLAESFYRFGLLGTQSVNVKGTKIVPLNVVQTVAPPAPTSPEEVKAAIESGIQVEEGGFIITVEGKKDDRKVKYINYVNAPGLEESFRLFEVSSQSYLTGSCASLFTQLFIRDKVKATGVYPPEALDIDARNELLKEAAKIDITVDQISVNSV